MGSTPGSACQSRSAHAPPWRALTPSTISSATCVSGSGLEAKCLRCTAGGRLDDAGGGGGATHTQLGRRCRCYFSSPRPPQHPPQTAGAAPPSRRLTAAVPTRLLVLLAPLPHRSRWCTSSMKSWKWVRSSCAGACRRGGTHRVRFTQRTKPPLRQQTGQQAQPEPWHHACAAASLPTAGRAVLHTAKERERWAAVETMRRSAWWGAGHGSGADTVKLEAVCLK